MKRIFIITILAITGCLATMAQESPGMAHQTNGGDRYNELATLARPHLDYKVLYGEKTLIVSNATGICVMTITNYNSDDIVFGPISVDGDYDEVIINELPNAKYTVSLTVSSGCTFRWKLDMNSINPISNDGTVVIPQKHPDGPNSTQGGVWHRPTER